MELMVSIGFKNPANVHNLGLRIRKWLKRCLLGGNNMEFKPFQKIARLRRECVITEKLDGTNGSIYIGEDGTFLVGSRTRWVSPRVDNFGFALWAEKHKDELLKLGPGHHFGEWWGVGIQRGYDLSERRFSLFHTAGIKELPSCCRVVPTLYEGVFDTDKIEEVFRRLQTEGSLAEPGYMKPEGIVVYHKASRTLFKRTFEGDLEGKKECRELLLKQEAESMGVVSQEPPQTEEGQIERRSFPPQCTPPAELENSPHEFLSLNVPVLNPAAEGGD